jgi:hypothetical protein
MEIEVVNLVNAIEMNYHNRHDEPSPDSADVRMKSPSHLAYFFFWIGPVRLRTAKDPIEHSDTLLPLCSNSLVFGQVLTATKSRL